MRQKIGAALAVLTILASLFGLASNVGATPGQPTGSDANQPHNWENWLRDARGINAACYKHGDRGSNEHGKVARDSGIGKTYVQLNPFNQSWFGDHWALLVVKGGDANAVIERPTAGTRYFAPVNNSGKPADVSHWIVCKGETPQPPKDVEVTPSVSFDPPSCENPNGTLTPSTDPGKYTHEVTGPTNARVVAFTAKPGFTLTQAIFGPYDMTPKPLQDCVEYPGDKVTYGGWVDGEWACGDTTVTQTRTKTTTPWLWNEQTGAYDIEDVDNATTKTETRTRPLTEEEQFPCPIPTPAEGDGSVALSCEGISVSYEVNTLTPTQKPGDPAEVTFEVKVNGEVVKTETLGYGKDGSWTGNLDLYEDAEVTIELFAAGELADSATTLIDCHTPETPDPEVTYDLDLSCEDREMVGTKTTVTSTPVWNAELGEYEFETSTETVPFSRSATAEELTACDVCLNIDGTQFEVPEGMVQGEDGICETPEVPEEPTTPTTQPPAPDQPEPEARTGALPRTGNNAKALGAFGLGLLILGAIGVSAAQRRSTI